MTAPLSSTREKMLREAVLACDRFFKEAMPKMNVGASALDANAIDAWNKAELAICNARRALQKDTP